MPKDRRFGTLQHGLVIAAQQHRIAATAAFDQEINGLPA